LRDERLAIPIGCYSPEYGVTLSLPGIVGREGVLRTLEPELSGDERQGLLRSVDTLKAALGRIRKSELQPS
jgi:L-lactate dehydrogenase